MFKAFWIQITNQAINLEPIFSFQRQYPVLSRTIYKGDSMNLQSVITYLYHGVWNQKASFERVLRALMRAFPESIGGV